MKSNFFSKTLLSNGVGRGITSSTLQSAIVLVIVFSFFRMLSNKVRKLSSLWKRSGMANQSRLATWTRSGY